MLTQLWVDATRWTVEWTRYWLDNVELMCDTIEDQ